MKGTTFAEYIRKKTKTNANTFVDADLLTFANTVKDDLAAEIVANVDEHYFDFEDYRTLEAGVRSYTFPNDMLKHTKYIAAKLDGTNWVYLTETDYSQFKKPMRENSHIKEVYAGKDPEFYVSGRELVILSGDDIIDVVDGLKIVSEIYPEDLTAPNLASSDDLSIPSSTVTHRLPRQVHKHWATKVVIEWKESRDKPIALTQREQRVDVDLESVFEKLQKRNQVRSHQASVPVDNGYDY